MDDMTRESGLQALWDSSQLSGENAAYLEGLYEAYLQNPASVSEVWKRFFETLARTNNQGIECSHAAAREAMRLATRQPNALLLPVVRAQGHDHEHKQVRVLQLINAYRFRGHQIADIDPLQLRAKPQL
ncbi:2-oxoglutarate dehydrogenase E1 component, partial [hydrothermal vent metagenome]